MRYRLHPTTIGVILRKNKEQEFLILGTFFAPQAGRGLSRPPLSFTLCFMKLRGATQ